MRVPRLRSRGKSLVALLCAACFLAAGIGGASRTAAAGTWETWPRKMDEPAPPPSPATDVKEGLKNWKVLPEKPTESGGAQVPSMESIRAAGISDAAGRKAEPGISYGTIGWIVLGIAAAVGIGLAAGGGGGGDGGGVVVNPGHQ